MNEPSTLELIARRLSYAGMALLAAAMLAFVWAVGFTRGVDGLIEGLVFTGLGLFLPGAATLWLSSVIASAAAANPPRRKATAARPRKQPRWLQIARGYLIASVAVAAAAIIRIGLAPYVGATVPYATFFLAVAIAAWAGGMGPGTFAALATVVIVRRTILDAPAMPVSLTGEWIGAALFLTVALSISAITSALRAARSGNLALRADLRSRDAQFDEQEAHLREVADDVPVMLWWCRVDGRCAYVNSAWRDFTGRTLDDSEGDGWQRGVHPDDLARWKEALATAVKRRQAFSINYRRQDRDGGYRTVRDEAKPRVLGDGEIAGFTGRTHVMPERGRVAAGATASSEG